MREAHVLAPQHVDDLLARVERHVGHTRHREHERRQHEVVELVAPAHLCRIDADGHREPERKPAQPHREHHERHEPEPERGRRGQEIAPASDDAVGRTTPIRAGDDAKHKPNDAREQPCHEHEHERVDEALPHHLRDGRVEAQAHAEVSVERRARPAEVALPDGQVGPPVRGELRPLRRVHARVGRLAEVHLHRVDGRGSHEREGHDARGDEQEGEPHYLPHESFPRSI